MINTARFKMENKIFSFDWIFKQRGNLSFPKNILTKLSLNVKNKAKDK